MRVSPCYGFVHEKFVDKRLSDTRDDPKVDSLALSEAEQCQSSYKEYRTALQTALTEGNFAGIRNALDAYLQFAKEVELRGSKYFKDKTKYYSSILEEFPVLVCQHFLAGPAMRDLVADSGGRDLFLGGYDCLIRVGANPDGSPFRETKRIDFCVAIYSDNLLGYVPLLGYEVKKYVDKTMFGTILETYKSLQIFRPRTRYGFIVEDEARADSSILNSPIYDNEFVLTSARRSRGSSRNPIDSHALERFVIQLEKELFSAIHSLGIKVTFTTGGSSADEEQ